MTKLDDLALHMITYYAADPARIQHFIKVHSFAALIARQEGMDAATLEILEAAAYVHDIGIKPAEQTYGSSAGKYQEELGPAPARAMMLECGFTPAQAEQLFLVTVDLNIPVICYGLRADFMNRGFPGSTRLLELAHTIEEMKTICACGRKATCNCRKVNGEFVFEGEQVAIDLQNDVQYVSMCPQCYFKARKEFYAKRAEHLSK